MLGNYGDEVKCGGTDQRISRKLPQSMPNIPTHMDATRLGAQKSEGAAAGASGFLTATIRVVKCVVRKGRTSVTRTMRPRDKMLGLRRVGRRKRKCREPGSKLRRQARAPSDINIRIMMKGKCHWRKRRHHAPS